MTEGHDSPTASPLVSVLITTYNRPAYLRKAVETVCAQTYDPIELVVVDDYSREPAAPLVDDVDTTALETVTCVRHDENQGANAARNTGIEAAAGAYLAFLDDDDRWEPEKIQRQVDAVTRNDDAGVVYTGMRAVRDGDERVKTPPKIAGDMTKALLCRNVVGTLSAVMVRTELAEAVPLDERFPSWADLEWYVRLSKQTEFERIAAPLVIYEFDSHNRLSDDFAKTRESYGLFLSAFDDLAAQYGRLFRRKMRGWAAFRAGTAAMRGDRYDVARRYLATAVARYPFEPQFYSYLVASGGGPYTHKLASTTNRLLP